MTQNRKRNEKKNLYIHIKSDKKNWTKNKKKNIYEFELRWKTHGWNNYLEHESFRMKMAQLLIGIQNSAIKKYDCSKSIILTKPAKNRVGTKKQKN